MTNLPATWETVLQQQPTALSSLETISLQSAEMPTVITHQQRPRQDQCGDFPGDLIAAGFHAVGLLGHGGLGAVYLAVQPYLQRQVAVKVGLSPSAAHHLQAEARAAAAVEHPAVVPIHGAGPEHLLMPHLQGATFAQMHAAGEPLVSLVSDLRSVLDGLACAHGHGLLHRDLKPANLMRAVRDDGGSVCIIDWGLAVAITDEAESLAPRLSSANVCAGTPAFLPPEVARGEVSQVGPASDVFLIGAVLYFLLSGRAPYRGPQRQALRDAANGAWEPISDADTALLDLQCACMDRDPQRRPTLAALAADLDRWLADQQRLREAHDFADQALAVAKVAEQHGHHGPNPWHHWSQAIGLARTAADLGHPDGRSIVDELLGKYASHALAAGSLLLARHCVDQGHSIAPAVYRAVADEEGARALQRLRLRRARRVVIAAALLLLLAALWSWSAVSADTQRLTMAETERREHVLSEAEQVLKGPMGRELPGLSQVAMTLASLDRRSLGSDDRAEREALVRQQHAEAVAQWLMQRQRPDRLSQFADLQDLSPASITQLKEAQAVYASQWQRARQAATQLAQLQPTEQGPWTVAQALEPIRQLPRDPDSTAAFADVVQPLLAAPLPAVRLAAFNLLLDRHRSAASAACWLLLDDPDPSLRQAASAGFARIRPDADAQALAQRLIQQPELGSRQLAQWPALLAALDQIQQQAAHGPDSAMDLLAMAHAWRGLGERGRSEAAIKAVPMAQRGPQHWDVLLGFYGDIAYLGSQERMDLSDWVHARLAFGPDLQASRLLFVLYTRFLRASREEAIDLVDEFSDIIADTPPEDRFVLYELVRYFPHVFPVAVPAEWHQWYHQAIRSLRRAQAMARPMAAHELIAAMMILSVEFPDEATVVAEDLLDRHPEISSWRRWRDFASPQRQSQRSGFLYAAYGDSPTNYRLLYELTLLELARGDYPRAAIMGRLAATRHPRDGESLNAHGRALASTNHLLPAVARFRQAARALPRNAGVLDPGAHSAMQAGLWGDYLYFQEELSQTARARNQLLAALLSHGAADAALRLAARTSIAHRRLWLTLTWEPLWPLLASGHEPREADVARWHLQQALSWASSTDEDLRYDAGAEVFRRLAAIPSAHANDPAARMLAAWFHHDQSAYAAAAADLAQGHGLLGPVLGPAMVNPPPLHQGQPLALLPPHRQPRPLQAIALTEDEKERLADLLTVDGIDPRQLATAIAAIPSSDEPINPLSLKELQSHLPHIDPGWDQPPEPWGSGLPYPIEPPPPEQWGAVHGP